MIFEMYVTFERGETAYTKHVAYRKFQIQPKVRCWTEYPYSSVNGRV